MPHIATAYPFHPPYATRRTARTNGSGIENSHRHLSACWTHARRLGRLDAARVPRPGAPQAFRDPPRRVTPRVGNPLHPAPGAGSGCRLRRGVFDLRWTGFPTPAAWAPGKAPARHRHRGRCLPRARSPDSDGGSPAPRRPIRGWEHLGGLRAERPGPTLTAHDGLIHRLRWRGSLAPSSFARPHWMTRLYPARGVAVPVAGYGHATVFPLFSANSANLGHPATAQEAGTPRTPSPGPRWGCGFGGAS